MKSIRLISILLFSLVILPTSNASAVTLVISMMRGEAPANAAGGGNLSDIVNEAARIWESAIADPVTITLHVGWAPIGDAGNHAIVEQRGFPNRETVGMILFDNTGSTKFYLDPTPALNEEYRRKTDEYQDLGGGFINVARLYSSPVGEAAGRTDLLSVALHEVGHALGMCMGNAAFASHRAAGAIQVSRDLPFTGTVVPLASNYSGVTSHFDALQVTYGALMAGIGSDERRLPSDLDILADAQVSGFHLIDVGFEPSRGLSHTQISATTTATNRRQ